MASKPPDGVDEIDSAIQNLALTLKRYGRTAHAGKAGSKLLVSQLRRERLRALTAMARTRALLAEMELHVVEKQLDAMKKRGQSPGASDERPSPNHRSRLTSQDKLKHSRASERRVSKNVSCRSSLHKLDKRSLKITKPTCRNCWKLQIRKRRTTESPKRPNESEPQRIPSDALENATVNNAVPDPSKRFKQDGRIDVINPCQDKAEVDRSSNEAIPKTNIEAPKTSPKVGTSPIAKKIFGIANYNVDQHENTAKSVKDSSRKMLQEIAKRTSTPNANSKNRANRINKAGKPPLSSISQKDKAMVPKKPAAEVMRKETGKKQTVKETPSLRISLPLSSKLDSKVEKVRKSLFGVTKEHHSAKDLKTPSKATPTAGNNKKEKEKQTSHKKTSHESQEKIETAKVRANKDIRGRGKENMTPQSLPIRVGLSELKKNIADFQNDKDNRKSVAVENKKGERKNEKVPKPSVRVCLPLTQSNLAYFNRNNVCSQSQEKAPERITQIADNNVKQKQSLKISVPLNNCLSYTEAEHERSKKNQEFLERQTGRLVAWKSINWESWEAQKKKEEYTRAEADRRLRENYTFVKNGPLRKVSWEEFTRRLGMNQGADALPSQSTPAKRTCVEQRVNDKNVENLPADHRTNELTADHGTNEDLETPSTQLTENEGIAKADQEATNAIFNQIMVKKERYASNADDSRSISSNDTALLCTRCQCLHESKECPNMKYFKFLGIDIKKEI